MAVTLEGCLHRFVRQESLGAHDRWICTRRAVQVRVRAGVRVSARVEVVLHWGRGDDNVGEPSVFVGSCHQSKLLSGC